MLETETSQIKQQSNQVSDLNQPAKPDRLALVSWLFLIGSLIFTVDSGLEMLEGISLHSIFHLSASLLFTLGSLLFLPAGQSE